jgi:hypothetical protein
VSGNEDRVGGGVGLGLGLAGEVGVVVVVVDRDRCYRLFLIGLGRSLLDLRLRRWRRGFGGHHRCIDDPFQSHRRTIRADAPIPLVEQQQHRSLGGGCNPPPEHRAVLGVERSGEAADLGQRRKVQREPHRARAARSKQLIGQALIEVDHVADTGRGRAARVQRSFDCGLDRFAQTPSWRMPSFGSAQRPRWRRYVDDQEARSNQRRTLPDPLFYADESHLARGARLAAGGGGGKLGKT